jgi:hypothetical protein
MESPFTSAIIAALAATFGGCLTAFVQWRITRASQAFQLKQESGKRYADLREKERSQKRQCIIDAHKILSKIGREFSITTLDIIWRSKMDELEYDKRYLAACDTVDELRAIADLSLPDLSEKVEKVYEQMNLFWGNFKEVLRLTHIEETLEKKQHFLSSAHAASVELGRHVYAAKARLSMQASNLREDG